MPRSHPIDDNAAKAILAMAEDLKAVKEQVDIDANESGREVQVVTAKKQERRPFVVEFDAIIDGNDQPDTDVYQWYYGWQRAELSDQGYGNWQAVTDGSTGDASDPDTRAMNLAEEFPGMGMTIDNLPDGFEPKPLEDGQPVRIRRLVTKTGKPQHIIIAAGAPNAIDGTC
ncbi:MAG: hypothetical protein QM754_18595 [Tepidisphaeraceae bacterium]